MELTKKGKWIVLVIVLVGLGRLVWGIEHQHEIDAVEGWHAPRTDGGYGIKRLDPTSVPVEEISLNELDTNKDGAVDGRDWNMWENYQKVVVVRDFYITEYVKWHKHSPIMDEQTVYCTFAVRAIDDIYSRSKMQDAPVIVPLQFVWEHQSTVRDKYLYVN